MQSNSRQTLIRVVTCRDIPELITQGDTIEECIAEATDALEECVSQYNARKKRNPDAHLPPDNSDWGNAGYN
jgi:predicted RNase H-like HicB family nuclease